MRRDELGIRHGEKGHEASQAVRSGPKELARHHVVPTRMHSQGRPSPVRRTVGGTRQGLERNRHAGAVGRSQLKADPSVWLPAVDGRAGERVREIALDVKPVSALGHPEPGLLRTTDQ